MASSLPVTYAFLIAFFSTWVGVSVVSNVSVMACLWKMSRDRRKAGRKSFTTTDILIISLAVNDILLAGVVLPQRIHDLSHTGHFHELSILCKMVNSLPILSITAGIYTMVVISIERVRCVLPAQGMQAIPMPDARSLGIRGTIVALALVWTSSIILTVPAAVNFNTVTVADNSSDESRAVCSSTWNNLQTSIYSIFVLVVSYLLPQVIIYVNYGRLAGYLWTRHRAVAAASAQPQAVGGARRQGATPIARSTLRTVKMVVVISVLFLASWAPYFTIMTIEMMTGYDSSHDTSPENIAMLAFAVFSTSYNLPVYLRYNLTFRRSYLRILRRKVSVDFRNNDPVSTTRPETKLGTTRGKDAAAGTGSRATVERPVTTDDNEMQPSTSQDCRTLADVTRNKRVTVAWAAKSDRGSPD